MQASNLSAALGQSQTKPIQEALTEASRSIPGKETIEQVLSGFDHKVWQVRKLCADFLIKNLQAAFPYLVQSLQNKSPNVRYWALQCLNHGGQRTVAALIRAYPDFSHEDKIYALRSFAFLKEAEVIPFALKQLDSDLWSIRQEASKIFLGLGQAGVNALKDALRDGTDHQRYWAFKLLGRMAGEKAIATFQTVLFSKEYDAKTRSYALSGLKEIKSDKTIPLLINALDSDLWAIRAQASKILIHHGEEPQLQLIEALKSDRPNLQYWSAQILKEILSEKYLAHLEECLASDNPEIKYQTVTLIAKVKSAASISLLLNLLDDSIWYIRKHVADSLLDMGSCVMRPILERLPEASEESLFWLCRILGQLANPLALKGLEKLLGHERRDVRLYALEAIARIGDEYSVQILIRAFENEFWILRSKASEALIQMGTKAILPLLAHLHSNSDSVHFWVQKTLEESEFPGARILASFLEDAKTKERKEIIFLLEQLSSETLQGIYSKSSLKRQDLLRQIQLQNRFDTPSASALFGRPLEFTALNKTEFSHEQKQRFLDLLDEAAQAGASQVHLKIGSVPMGRVNGTLCRLSNTSLSSEDVQEFLRPWLSEEQIEQYLNTGHLDFLVHKGDQEQYRARMSRQLRGTEAVLHRVSHNIPDFQKLNYPLEFFESLAKLPKGLILVSGNSGSGKSLCCLSILNYVNRHFVKNIVALEDEIEYPLSSIKSLISQRKLGVDFLNYESEVESIHRDDPDILYLGRMPEFPQLEGLLHLAVSRCLVILETNASSTRDAFEKLLSAFPQSGIKVYEKLVQRSLVASVHLKLVNQADQSQQITALEYFMNNSLISNSLSWEGLGNLSRLLRDSKLESVVGLDDYLMQLAAEQKITYQEAVRFMEDKTRISINQIW